MIAAGTIIAEFTLSLLSNVLRPAGGPAQGLPVEASHSSSNIAAAKLLLCRHTAFCAAGACVLCILAGACVLCILHLQYIFYLFIDFMHAF